MEDIRKAIILDMDETLETGSYKANDEFFMKLRPNLDDLIVKLQEAKTKGIDIILCTTARQQWVDVFLALKPEFTTIFDKIYSRDNEEEWKNYNEKEYPIEYAAKSKNINIEYMKPVTTFGYNQILFIDDSKMESLRLKILFDIAGGELDKDVTFFTAFGFKYDSKHQESNIDITQNEVGCDLMCLEIDKFINKEFKSGLTIADDDYIQKYEIYNKELVRKFRKYQFTDEVIIELFKYCNEKCALDKRYILAVAESWHSNSITTMEDLSKFYAMQKEISKIATVIKSRFKLKRDITQYEQCYIEKWIKEYGYNVEIIQLALDIKGLKADSFIDKMDKIIADWYDRNLKTYDEIQDFINTKIGEYK